MRLVLFLAGFEVGGFETGVLAEELHRDITGGGETSSLSSGRATAGPRRGGVEGIVG